MTDSLRQLVASFTVEVDKAGALKQGNAQVDALKGNLGQLEDVAKVVGAAISNAFKASAAAVNAFDEAIRKASADARQFAQLGALTGMTGRGDQGGFAGLGALRDAQRAGRNEAIARAAAPAPQQFGPVRPTMLQSLQSRVLGVRASFADLGRTASNALAPVGKNLSAILGPISPITLGLAGIGVAAAMATRAIINLVQEMGGLGEEASRLGVSSAEFQRLRVLAAQNATSVQALGTAFRTVGKAAADPTEETTKAFKALGVEVKDSNGAFKSRSDLFFETAGALADIDDETVRVTRAQQLYGRSAIELLPLLANGRKGIDEQREALMKLPIASQSAIDAADKLSDKWETFGQVILGRIAPILEKDVIPALEAITDAILQMIEAGLLPFIATSFKTLATPVRMAYNVFSQLFRLFGGEGSASIAKIASWVYKLGVALQTLVMFPLLLAEDFQGYLEGKDSVIGRAINGLKALFELAAESVQTAFSAAFDWLLEQAAVVGAKVADLLTPEGVKVAMNAVGAIEAAASPVSIPSAGGRGADQQTVYDPATGSFQTVSITINNPAPGEGMKLAGQVKGVLERPRDAVLGTVQ
jgi:hypothetical protein